MGPTSLNKALSTLTPMISSTLTPVSKPRRALRDVNPNLTATTPGKVKTVFRGSCSLTVAQPVVKSFVETISQPTTTTHSLVEKEPSHEVAEPSPSADTNDDDMPQWLRSAESILQGNEAEGLSPGISEETAARVALSWLGAGSSEPKGAKLLDAEVRCMQDRRHAAVAEQRALKAEVAALQAAQAHLEAKGEAYASEREAACRLEALEEAAEAERAAAAEREAAAEARASELREEVGVATRARDAAETGRLEAVRAAELCAAELKATSRAISRLDASKRAAERERETALAQLSVERETRAGERGEAEATVARAEAEAARLRLLLDESRDDSAEAEVRGRGEAAEAARELEAELRELEAELVATREQRDLLARRVLVQSAAAAAVSAAVPPAVGGLVVVLHKPSTDVRTGVRLGGKSGPPTITAVAPGSIGEAMGLCVGDRLLTVNGAVVDGHAKATQMIRDAVGEVQVRVVAQPTALTTAPPVHVAARKKQQPQPQPQPQPQQKKPVRGHFVAVAAADGFAWQWRSR